VAPVYTKASSLFASGFAGSRPGWRRINALITRYFYQLSHDRWHLADMFYWPFFDLAAMGYLATWVSRDAGSSWLSSIIGCMVLWQLVVQTNFVVSKNALLELISANVLNLFTTPIQIREWLTACCILSAAVGCTVLLFCSLVALLFFGYNLFSLGWLLVPVVINLYLSGIALGTFVTALLFYYGIRAQTVTYMLGWIFGLIGGSYYPADVLPLPLWVIARCIPLSYAFDVVRYHQLGTTFIWQNLVAAAILNVVYLLLATSLVRRLFSRTLRYGLARLTY